MRSFAPNSLLLPTLPDCLSISRDYREADHPLTRRRVFLVSRTVHRFIWVVPALRSVV